MTLWRVITTTSGKSCFVRSCSVLIQQHQQHQYFRRSLFCINGCHHIPSNDQLCGPNTSTDQLSGRWLHRRLLQGVSTGVNISWWGVCLWRSTSSSRPGPRDDDVMHRTMLGTVCSPWLQRWWSCFPILILNFSSLSINQCFHDNHHNHRNCILIIASLL